MNVANFTFHLNRVESIQSILSTYSSHSSNKEKSSFKDKSSQNVGQIKKSKFAPKSQAPSVKRPKKAKKETRYPQNRLLYNVDNAIQREHQYFQDQIKSIEAKLRQEHKVRATLKPSFLIFRTIPSIFLNNSIKNF